jgi:hypothetical protein
MFIVGLMLLECLHQDKSDKWDLLACARRSKRDRGLEEKIKNFVGKTIVIGPLGISKHG